MDGKATIPVITRWRGTLLTLATLALLAASCGGQPGGGATKPADRREATAASSQVTEAECGAPTTEIRLVALESETGEPPSFDKDCITVPAGEPFTVRLENKDFLEHNFSLFTDEQLSELIFRGERFRGPDEAMAYDVPGVVEPGEYTFVCDVHLTLMRGTLVAQ